MDQQQQASAAAQAKIEALGEKVAAAQVRDGTRRSPALVRLAGGRKNENNRKKSQKNAVCGTNSYSLFVVFVSVVLFSPHTARARACLPACLPQRRRTDAQRTNPN